MFDEAARARLYTADLAAGIAPGGAAEPLAAAFGGDPLAPEEAAIRADLRMYLPDDILVKIDVASMAHGLEVRAPLLDHRIVEFAASLPLDAKLGLFGGKRLLRRVARSLLPAPVLRRKKMGFATPIGSP